MTTPYNLHEALQWKIIVDINPTIKTGPKFYAEISKVDNTGTLFGTKWCRYYDSPAQAFDALFMFAVKEGLVLSEEQLIELGYYEKLARY